MVLGREVEPEILQGAKPFSTELLHIDASASHSTGRTPSSAPEDGPVGAVFESGRGSVPVEKAEIQKPGLVGEEIKRFL